MYPCRAAFNRIFIVVALLTAAAGVGRAQTNQWDPQAWRKYNSWEISGLAVTGAPPELEKELKKGLRTGGQWKLLRGMERPPFAAKDLLEDLRRVRLFLARAGYPASQVHPTFETDDHAETLSLTLVVDPGPQVRVAEIHYEGWPEGVPHPPVTNEDLMQPGQAFTDEAFDHMAAAMLAWLHDAGYAQVDVLVAPRFLSPEAVELQVFIEPGDFYRIAEVVIEGCSDDLVPVARRVLDIQPGSAFSATRIARASTDLRGTQLFSRVAIEPEVMGSGELRLHVRLTNARMKLWRVSVGTWTDNPWMVRVGWSHNNLFRRSRGLDVRGTVATHEISYGVSYFWLGWLSPRARSAYRIERIIEEEDAYRSNEYRAEFVQSFRPSNRTYANIGIGLSNVEVETYSPDAEDIPDSQDWLLETWYDRKWDWTDDIMFPSRGGYWKLGLTFAPPADAFPSPYLKAQVDGMQLVPLSDRFGVAGRLRLGWSKPLGDSTDLLANRRFYAGGYNSMRGYERRGLGPKDSANNPRGGQAVVLAGAELRIRLVGIFDIALFADTGQVWRTTQEVRLDEIEVAVGADLDLRTPIGPLRVGYAWHVTEAATDADLAEWHFGIGYPW